MAKKVLLQDSKPTLKTVEVIPSCGCTWKPNPHTHNGKPTDEWNWEATHAIWAKEKPVVSRKFIYAKYRYAHLVPK
jgi:hypothetical protein